MQPALAATILQDLCICIPGPAYLGDPFATMTDIDDGSMRHVQGRVEGLYIVLISLHGLVRGQAMELGKDADTGGQVRSRNR